MKNKAGERTENEPRNNLIQFDNMDADRHRELSVKGGKASGAARRAKRERINAAKIAEIARIEAERDAPPPPEYNEAREIRLACMEWKQAMQMMKRGCRP